MNAPDYLSLLRQKKLLNTRIDGTAQTANSPLHSLCSSPPAHIQAEPFDPEAFEERAAICEFDGGLSRADAESLAWLEDDRRRCTQCQNLRQGVCCIAKPEVGALVVANHGYRPVRDIPRRCEGYAPKVDDPDGRPGGERWQGLLPSMESR